MLQLYLLLCVEAKRGKWGRMRFLTSFVGLPQADKIPTVFNEVKQKVNSTAENSQYYTSKQ
jgi:hypothetical protein